MRLTLILYHMNCDNRAQKGKAEEMGFNFYYSMALAEMKYSTLTIDHQQEVPKVTVADQHGDQNGRIPIHHS